MTFTGDHNSEPSSPMPAPAAESSPRSSLDWARKAGLGKSIVREMEIRVMEKKRRLRRRRVATAGGMLAFLLLAGGGWQIRRMAAGGASSSSAIVAMPARQQLPDGSIVEAKAGASITVDYGAAFRRVVLHRGEAHFQVAKYPGRPFIVSAAGVEVRAVGTAFSVQLGLRAIEVLVTEGTVAVEQEARTSNQAPGAKDRHVRGGSPPPTVPESLAPLRVVAGNRVRIEMASAPVAPPPVVPVPAAELADRLAWRVPRLEFSGTPLAEALALFNRHSAVHLSLADPRLGTLKLSGIVRADNTDTLLQLLQSEFGLAEERRTKAEIVLRKDYPPPAAP